MNKRIPPLGEDPKADLKDFCAANYAAPKARVIADALRSFIRAKLDAEPELRRRFDAARRKRIGDKAQVIPIGPHIRAVK